MPDIDISTLIEALKQEIAFRAKWAGIPFDREDIEHHEVYAGHWLVALMWIKVPYLDDQLIQHGTKRPNIWTTPPPPDFVKFLPTDDPWVYKVACFVPNLHILKPELIYLIFPDGSYKSGGTDLANWFDAEEKHRVKEDVERIVNRWRKHA